MENKTNEKKCPTCGHLLVEYKFSLNKGLIGVLIKLFEARGPVEISKLNLSNSQYSNYPKLFYWKLARRHVVDDNPKGGLWKITTEGIDFVVGMTSAPKYVVMRQGQFVEYRGPRIKLREANDGYEYQSEYRDQVVRQLQSKQGELFL